jgi:outer membrane protein TolC
MLKKIFLLFCGIIVLSINSFAFDPLLGEKNTPKKYYDVYGNNTSDIEKECSLVDFSNNTIDMYKAIDIALCRNPDTKISWFSVKKQAANLGSARSGYLPSVDFSASTGESKSGASTYSSSTNFSFDWLLYDFGKREANVDSEYFSLLKTNYQHNGSIQTVIYDVIESYGKLFAAKEAVVTAKKSEGSYKTAYSIAKEKYDLGIVPKSDVLQADTKYAQSILSRQKAENTFLNYQGDFTRILNLKQGTEFTLEQPNFIWDFRNLEYNIDKLIDQALENRNDMKALIAKEKASKSSYLATSKTSMPTISMYGSSGKTYYRHDIRNDSDSSSIGLRLSIPMFTGFEQTYNNKKASYDYESIQQEKEQLKSETAYEVWAAYNDLNSARENVMVADKLLASALESKNVTLGMYKVGRSSMLDVLQVESSYSDAENEKTIAEYDRLVAEASLLKSLGILTKTIENK